MVADIGRGLILSGEILVRYSTIDHALGDQQGRYFGQGHRRSIYSFTPTEVAPGRVVGVCIVGQEGRWSTKQAGVVSRHLSTIDAVSLAGLALEAALESEPVAIESLFVTDLTIRAGAAATEDTNAVPLEATLVWDAATRVFDCAVTLGTMKLTLRVEAFAGSRDATAPDSAPRFYAEHLQNRIQHISDIDIDCDAGRMRSKLGVLAVRHAAPSYYSGLQSAHVELISISEAIVCLAQLAQTFAYEVDQMSRDESAVFWLRRLTVSLPRPRLRVGQLIDMEVRVAQTRELRMRDQLWRTLRLTAEAPGLNAIADVAHILPKERVDA